MKLLVFFSLLVTSLFAAERARPNIIVAQGGATNGYAIFVADGELRILFKKNGKTVSSFSSPAVAGPYCVKVILSKDGKVPNRFTGTRHD